MQKPISLIFLLLFTLPAVAEIVSIRELALGTPLGTAVEVRLRGHQKPNKLRGRMGLLDNSAFSLVVDNSNEARSIPFDEVKSLRWVKTPPAQPDSSGLTPQAAAHAIPKGSLVEARFLNKREPRWLRGRVAEVRDQDMQIQVFQSGAVKVDTVSFSDIESLKAVESLTPDSKAAKIGRSIGTGASIALTGALVLVAILGIMAATGHLGG